MKLIFFGSSQFSDIALQALLDNNYKVLAVYTQKPKPFGRGQKDALSPVHQLALRNNLIVKTPVSLKQRDERKKFLEFQCDLGIVVAYGLLLPQQILDAPMHGCINVHASLLPRWRGAAPIQRSILAGDKRTGITIMQMNAGLDTGNILNSKDIKISSDTNFLDLEKTLSILGCNLLIETIKNLSIGSLEGKKQPTKGITYAKKISKNEGRVDWRCSAEDIARKVRALNPWPGVWFEDSLNNSRTIIKIHSVEVVDGRFGKKVGIVLDEKLTIACGDNAVRILTLQRAGKKIMTAAEYLRGNPISVGHQFC